MCLTCVNPISGQRSVSAPLYGTVLFSSSKVPAYPNNTPLWQPKIGASWGLNRNMVLHMGWTYSKALGIELGGQSEWDQSTNYNDSPDGGLTPSMAFNNGKPYPSGYITPPGSSLGALALVGQGFASTCATAKSRRCSSTPPASTARCRSASWRSSPISAHTL